MKYLYLLLSVLCFNFSDGEAAAAAAAPRDRAFYARDHRMIMDGEGNLTMSKRDAELAISFSYMGRESWPVSTRKWFVETATPAERLAWLRSAENIRKYGPALSAAQMATQQQRREARMKENMRAFKKEEMEYYSARMG